LIEKGRENLLTYSNQFDTTWIKSSPVLTLTDNQSGYDGLSNAWKLESTSSISSLSLSQTLASSGVQVFSVYAKAGSVDWVRINLSGVGNRFFNISNGTIGSAGSLEGTITSAGNGWYRISILGNGSSSAPLIFPSSNDDDTTLSNGDNIYIQDAQLEIGLAATEVIESGATTGKAGLLEDEPRFDYSGGATCPSLLLEGSRTNLVSQSEYFGDTQWSINNASLDANNTTSVEGLQNAYKITDDSNTGYHKVSYLNAFVSDGVMRTWSVFVRQGNARYCAITHASVFSSAVNSLIFDMQEGVYTNEGTTDYFDIVHDPIDMGNGWWRIGFSSDINSSSYDNFSIGISQGASWTNNLSYTGDGSLDFYIYGAQTEAGSYPTSYIPNHSGTGSVTRGADDCQVEDLQSNGIVGNTWTYFFEWGDYVAERNFEMKDSTSFNFLFMVSRLIRYIKQDTSADTLFSLPTNGTSLKALISYDGTTLKGYLNGSLINSVNDAQSSSFSDFDFLRLDRSFNDTEELKQLLIFPTALTDSECIKLTTL